MESGRGPYELSVVRFTVGSSSPCAIHGVTLDPSLSAAVILYAMLLCSCVAAQLLCNGAAALRTFAEFGQLGERAIVPWLLENQQILRI